MPSLSPPQNTHGSLRSSFFSFRPIRHKEVCVQLSQKLTIRAFDVYTVNLPCNDTDIGMSVRSFMT